MDLTDQQQAGIEKIRGWYTGVGPELRHDGSWSAPVFRLFGPAGTGKTTMAKAIPEALGLTSVRYGTFTGKAAHVLRSKGATPVGTIHSGIYYPTTNEEAKEKLRLAQVELDEILRHGEPARATQTERDSRAIELEAEISVLQQDSRRMAWEWNPESEWSRADLIILDEVSMVGAKLAADIEAYGVPILVLGDPAQLPPVEGGGYYTDAKPDHLLTEIHRQALESPVLELATRVRLSTDSRLGLTEDDLSPASIGDALEHDQVLCWSNRRRWAMITVMRRKLGRPEGEVVAGDRIMCLANNKDLAVFNGQQFNVLAVQSQGALGPTLMLRDDEGRERSVPVFADGFGGQELQDQAKKSGAGWKGQRMLATFANVITVHKAQGSEWDSVYVVNETPNMISMTTRREGREAAVAQARAWMYTGISRASQKVTVTATR
jgi:exodeoxyribonuclease-5